MHAGRQDIGSEDYAGRFNQLFGSIGVLTLQYSRHNDQFKFKPLDPTGRVTYFIADGEPGEVTMALRDTLTGIQRGTFADTHGWMARLS